MEDIQNSLSWLGAIEKAILYKYAVACIENACG